MSAPRIQIDDLAIDAADWPDEFGHSYVWRTTEYVPQAENCSDDAGRILVTVNVDGTIDTVHADLGQSGHLAALERAITALTQVQAGLTRAYQGNSRPGLCFAQGDWGRCRSHHGHSDGHDFPPEPQRRASRVRAA